MELRKVIKLRTSVRSFLPEAVPEKDIIEMVRLVGMATGVNNFKPWEFILVREKKILQNAVNLVLKQLEDLPLKKVLSSWQAYSVDEVRPRIR